MIKHCHNKFNEVNKLNLNLVGGFIGKLEKGAI